MTLDELIAEAHATVIDEAYVVAMERRLAAAEEEFERETRAKRPTVAWLAREYTI